MMQKVPQHINEKIVRLSADVYFGKLSKKQASCAIKCLVPEYSDNSIKHMVKVYTDYSREHNAVLTYSLGIFKALYELAINKEVVVRNIKYNAMFNNRKNVAKWIKDK